MKLFLGNWIGCVCVCVCVEFIRLADNRDKWLALLNTKINSGSKNADNLLAV